MAQDKVIPSVNIAINEALDEYMKRHKTVLYEAKMKEAGRDKSFLSRTMICADDFIHVDSETSGN